MNLCTFYQQNLGEEIEDLVINSLTFEARLLLLSN